MKSTDSYSFQFNTTPPSSGGGGSNNNQLSSSPPGPPSPTNNSGLNINFSSSVNPSMLFYTGLNSGPMDNLPDMSSSSSTTSSSSPIMGPKTPKTFSSIIHSSPSIYSPVEFTRPNYNNKKENKLSSPLSFAERLQQNNNNNSNPLSKRRNVENLKISQLNTHKNNNTNGLGLDIGPLSAPAPIRSSSSSSSMKRRVSLNISTGGRAAVVEETSEHDQAGPEVEIPRSKSAKCFKSSVPMTRNYTDSTITNTNNFIKKHSNTIYDRSVDYLNDSARRMSLESLFPELSPQMQQQRQLQQHNRTVNPCYSMAEFTMGSSSESTSTSTSDSEDNNSVELFSHLTNYDEDDDEEEEEEDDGNSSDARFALKKALERNNSSTKSLVDSRQNFPYTTIIDHDTNQNFDINSYHTDSLLAPAVMF